MSTLSINEALEYLHEVVDALPTAIVEQLNGGISLLPDTRQSPHSVNSDYYMMGRYCYEPRGLGRYIQIFYGSFVAVYGFCSEETQKEELRKVLMHELTHHIESLAGISDLEKEDRTQLLEYLERAHDSE